MHNQALDFLWALTMHQMVAEWWWNSDPPPNCNLNSLLQDPQTILTGEGWSLGSWTSLL